MKKLLFTLMMILTVQQTYALTLKEATRQIASKYLSQFNDIDENYSYILEKIDTKYSDFNKDGQKDAAVLLTFCEEQNCHATTQRSVVIAFLDAKTSPYYLGSEHVTGLNPTMKIVNNKIQVTGYRYGNSDAACCPSKKTREIFRFVNGRLSK